MGESAISLYNTGFWISTVITAIGLLVSIATFFMYDIPTNFAVRTGRAMKKSVDESTNNPASTGEPRKDYSFDYETAAITKAQRRKRGKGQTQNTTMSAPLPTASTQETTPLQPKAQQPQAAPETTVLEKAAKPQPTQSYNAPVVAGFKIIENVMVIHTDEEID